MGVAKYGHAMFMQRIATLTVSLPTFIFRLQQEPTEPVNVTLHVDSTAFRVSLSRYTVSFNSSNWNKPQLVHIQAGASFLESADEPCCKNKLDHASQEGIWLSPSMRATPSPPAEEDVPEEEGAAEFRLDLSWPAAWANGTLVQRTKTIR